MAEPFDAPLPAVGQKPWTLNPAITEMRDRLASTEDAVSGPALEAAVQQAAENLPLAEVDDAIVAGKIADPASATNASLVGQVEDSESPVGSALTAKIEETAEPVAQAAASAYLATQPGVEAAAAAAVGDAVEGLAVAIRLVETSLGGTPDPLIGLTTVRGTPVFETPAKQGSGSLRGGAVLRTPLSLASGARATVEGFQRVDAAPSGSGDGAIRIIAFFADLNNTGAVHYLAVNADGTVRMISGGNNTNNKATGPNVVTSTFFHWAVCLYNSGSARRVEAVYIDGVALDGALWSTTATGIIDTLFLGGLHTATQFDSLTSWHTDSVRVSTGRRYSANFTPPASLAVDGSTTAFFTMDPQSGGTIGYPNRPDVPAGMVDYVGNTEPTSWLTGDRWYLK